MDHDDAIQKFLAALSVAKDEISTGNLPVDQHKSARTILQSCISKEGALLTLPSLNAHTCKSSSESTSFSKAVLKSALQVGNPLPAKSSLAKKLSSSHARALKSKAAQIKDNLSQLLRYDLQAVSDKEGEAIDSFSDALNAMNSNLDSTVEYLFRAQLAALLVKLGHSSIYNSKGDIPEHLAKVLAGNAPSPSNLYTEEKDQQTVADAMEMWEKNKTIIPVKEEVDAKLVVQSLNDEKIRFACSQDYPIASAFSSKANEEKKGDGHEANPTMKSLSDDGAEKIAPMEDSLGHIATITSIRESTKDSLHSMIKDNEVECNSRGIEVSVGKISTLFSLDRKKSDGVAVKDQSGMAITLTIKVSAKVAGDDHDLEFITPGSISGNFAEETSTLKAVEVQLDTKVFFEQTIRQINKAIKSFVSKQKPTPPRANVQSAALASEERIKNAQLLSAFGASVNTSQTAMNGSSNEMFHIAPTIAHLKRNRDSIESRNSMDMGLSRESRNPMDMGSSRSFQRQSLGGSIPTEGSEASQLGRRSSFQRFSGAPNPAMDTHFGQQPMSNLDAAIEALRMSSSNGEVNAAALAEAMRLKELDAFQTLRRGGGNSMAAAAEAVRRADAENNFQFESKETPTTMRMNLPKKKSSFSAHTNQGTSAHANAQNAALASGEHDNNAQLFSAFGASVNTNQTAMNGISNEMFHVAPTTARPKRSRDSMESRNSMDMESSRSFQRQSIGGSIPSEGSEASQTRRRSSLKRFSGVSHLDMDTLFRQQPMSNLDAAIEGLRMSSSNGEVNAAALAEAMRLTESDTFQSHRRSRDNSMAAAAEAVRRADAENNLQSLQEFSQMSSNLNGNLQMFSQRNSNSNGALQGYSQMDSNSNNNYNGGSNFDAAMTAAAFNARRQSYTNNTYSHNSQDVARMAEVEAAMNSMSRSGSGSFNMSSEALRLAEMESELRRGGSRLNHSSIAGNSDAVRLAEMESAMMHRGRSTFAGMESSMRRGSRPRDSMAAAAEAVRIAEMEAERRQSNSYSEAMQLVEMEAMRRSGTGTSMQSYGHPGQSGSRLLRNESLENLAALMRRSGGSTGTMTPSANTVSMAELERWSRLSNSGPSGSNAMSVAAEAASLAEMENELTRQLMESNQGAPTDHSTSMSTLMGMRNANGRRVSFGPDTLRSDTLHEQMRRFQR